MFAFFNCTQFLQRLSYAISLHVFVVDIAANPLDVSSAEEWDTEFTCDDYINGGGSYVSHSGHFFNPTAGGEAPDGLLTGRMNGYNALTLSYPSLDAGADLCVTVGFSSRWGKVSLELNGINHNINNPNRRSGYTLQQICIPTTTAGEQTLVVRDAGWGSIKVDGSIYEGCDFTPIDPAILIDSLQADDPNSYVILAENSATLRASTVDEGGIGVWKDGQDVNVNFQSEIGTFLRASDIYLSNDSDDGTLPQIMSPAPMPLEDAPVFTFQSGGTNLTIRKNQPDTTILDGTYYRKLSIQRNNHVKFTADTVYIESLSTAHGWNGNEVTIDFDSSTVLIVKYYSSFGRYTKFNSKEKEGVKLVVTDGSATVNNNIVDVI